MPIVDAYPILLEFKADGNIVTVRSLGLWVREFHIEPPRTAANDNSPEHKPIEWETHIDSVDAFELVRSMAEDENSVRNPKFKRSTPPYSPYLHEERFERVKSAGRSHPPLEEFNAEDETIRYVDALKMRSWLGADAHILDMAVEPHTTFDDIGRYIGADRAGGKTEVIDVAKVFYERAA